MIKVTVPATSANLGGGFDCLGLAVNIYNEIYVRESDFLKIETDAGIPANESNLVYKSILATFDEIVSRGGKLNALLTRYREEGRAPLYIRQINAIPLASGMGSSAACIVGGALAANALAGDVMTKNEIAAFCARREGHPDNVLPALFGGMVAGMMTDSGVCYVKENVAKTVKINVYTPSFPLPTAASRKALPAVYRAEDVVFSMSHAILTFSALASGDIKLLRSAVGDRLHEPYRSTLIADYDAVVALNRECGAIATYLSGAGPSIAAFVGEKFKSAEMSKRLSFLPNNWRMFECEADGKGARVEII